MYMLLMLSEVKIRSKISGNYRNYYKGHMDKTKGEGGGRGLQLGWGGGMGIKGTQL